jgi:hypothetical protein
MQLLDRANDVWRRIKQISPSDSATYVLADRRLKVGVPAPSAVEPGGAPPEGEVSSHKDVGGNADGPVMGISDVKTKETSDPEAETNLALEIGIKKQPGAVIDHNQVKILVFLYDIVNDKDIKLTDADVSNEWLTPKHDWSDMNLEVLLVRYVRAKNPAAPYPNHRSRRRRQKFGPVKRVVLQKAPRTSDSANISATSFAFITVTICRPSQAEPCPTFTAVSPVESPSAR